MMVYFYCEIKLNCARVITFTLLTITQNIVVGALLNVFFV